MNPIAADRLHKVREWMRQRGLDAILLRKRRSFAWLTGGRNNHIVHATELGVADLVVLQDRLCCVTTRMEADRIRDEELSDWDCDWIVTEWADGTDSAIRTLCQGMKVGCDVPPVTLGLKDAIDLSQPLAELAYVLDDADIIRYRELCQTAARALEQTCREIQPGMSEWQIQAMLGQKVMAQGINPHVMLVATDERIYRYRHPIPTAKPLERYAMLVLCAERGGLIANVTRFVHFGPLPEQLQVNKEKLARIDLAMNLATRPGTPIREVFQRGLEAYREAGYPDDWRLLHQGGPTGYAAREFLAHADCEGVVQCRQAFAWNPSIRGIKSEDTILVGPQDNEFLTQTGEWPSIPVEHHGKVYQRPDIMIRSAKT